MIIDEHKEIGVIKEEFNALFPYLKIEFSKSSGRVDMRPQTPLKNSGTLKTFRKSGSEGKVRIRPGMTVLELDRDFNNIYGIVVQVFRKSGKAWLEATFTEGWTLEEQNRQGQDLSS